VQIIGIRHAIGVDRHKVDFTLASTDTAAFVFAGGTVSSGTAIVAAYPFSIIAGGSAVGSPFGL
jgi:hypothetical protein